MSEYKLGLVEAKFAEIQQGLDELNEQDEQDKNTREQFEQRDLEKQQELQDIEQEEKKELDKINERREQRQKEREQRKKEQWLYVRTTALPASYAYSPGNSAATAFSAAACSAFFLLRPCPWPTTLPFSRTSTMNSLS